TDEVVPRAQAGAEGSVWTAFAARFARPDLDRCGVDGARAYRVDHHRRAHGRDGCESGHEPWEPRLVCRDLDADDGGDDAAVAGADGAGLRARRRATQVRGASGIRPDVAVRRWIPRGLDGLRPRGVRRPPARERRQPRLPGVEPRGTARRRRCTYRRGAV